MNLKKKIILNLRIPVQKKGQDLSGEIPNVSFNITLNLRNIIHVKTCCINQINNLLLIIVLSISNL
ncbi:hypothetical protein BpHYR1_013874 [Brachionus plicatilis]|uniref:Uncharacterized protein n=1 Tax=Brachionus plicatilis TaxID=10195 RepID=A0A3M7SAE3_BRAPC|nr:hypothetical protein BpHYR1_013874 [Brachionus plicatilis]